MPDFPEERDYRAGASVMQQKSHVMIRCLDFSIPEIQMIQMPKHLEQLTTCPLDSSDLHGRSRERDARIL